MRNLVFFRMLAFAFAYSFAVELLFEWPAAALLAFWEEALPLTDVIPSCTLGWALVLLGIRPWLRERQGLPPVEEDELPPVGQGWSYAPTEEWLREGSTPWE